jgi:hypothetical protein
VGVMLLVLFLQRLGLFTKILFETSLQADFPTHFPNDQLGRLFGNFPDKENTLADM